MGQKPTLLFSVITTAVILLVGCNKSSPPTKPVPVELKDTVTISVADVTHRSVSINVQCTMNNVQLSVSLYRTYNGADTLVANFPVAVKDTTIIDDNDGAGLLINTSYGYHAVLTDTTGAIKNKTDPITVSTLAPTSHNYTWQVFTIGDAGIQASVLEDVWGTDENNVWAVGGVRINGTQYGVLYWNGNEWIPDSTAGGYAIYGFNKSDIWTVGGGVFHFDGNQWSRVDANDTGQYVVPIDTILHDNIPYSSIWGTSSNNLYFGSGWGKIIHWDGTKAAVVVTTDQAILSIWGTQDNNIYAVAGDYTHHAGKLFHYDGSIWKLIRTGGALMGATDTQGPITSIWGTKNNELFLQARYIESRYGGLWKHEVLCATWMYEISGTNSNNIASCGAYGTIKHFNGIDWTSFEALTQRTLYGIHVFEKKIFAVGNRIILIGTNY